MTLLFLNSIGTLELVLIMFVILMLFGSKGLPDFAKNIGKGMREIKTASNEIKRDIQNSALEMRKDLKTDNILDDLKKIGDTIEGKDIEDDKSSEISEEKETISNNGPAGTKPIESSKKEDKA